MHATIQTMYVLIAIPLGGSLLHQVQYSNTKELINVREIRPVEDYN